MEAFTDIELYDPINKATFVGRNSWCEFAEDWSHYGETKWGENKQPMKYWVHSILVPVNFFEDNSFNKMQPFLIQTKVGSLPVLLDSFVLEDTTEIGDWYDPDRRRYSFTFVPIPMLDFVEMLNNIITEKLDEL